MKKVGEHSFTVRTFDSGYHHAHCSGCGWFSAGYGLDALRAAHQQHLDELAAAAAKAAIVAYRVEIDGKVHLLPAEAVTPLFGPGASGEPEELA